MGLGQVKTLRSELRNMNASSWVATARMGANLGAYVQYYLLRRHNRGRGKVMQASRTAIRKRTLGRQQTR